MVRADLLKANAGIFSGQGKALDKYASRDCKILVVGNPANTNALIAMTNAPSLPRRNFTAMTRLDQNRAEGQISLKTGVDVAKVSNIAIWGNHSKTMYADFNNGTADGQPILKGVNDEPWLKGDFVKTVQNRGKAIIDARGKSSAASAAKAAVDHMREWLNGTPEGMWSNMGVCSDGNSYGIPDDMIFSFPCVCKNGQWTIVDGLSWDAYSKEKVAATTKELLEEKAAALS
jgi:malate dehydrogenase